jgi:ApaG protein
MRPVIFLLWRTDWQRILHPALHLEPTNFMQTYVATTESITVSVRPIYLDGQSDPMSRKFVFAYFVDEVQLLRRHWFIHDSNGEVKEVEGEGVVGKQPMIPPGESHEYSSFCVLESFEGSMEGNYTMVRPSGDRFTVVIPKFTLRAAAN